MTAKKQSNLSGESNKTCKRASTKVYRQKRTESGCVPGNKVTSQPLFRRQRSDKCHIVKRDDKKRRACDIENG